MYRNVILTLRDLYGDLLNFEGVALPQIAIFINILPKIQPRFTPRRWGYS